MGVGYIVIQIKKLSQRRQKSVNHDGSTQARRKKEERAKTE